MAGMMYRAIFILSFFSLLFERFWSSFWPAVSAAAFYAGLSLLNVPEMFGAWGHALLFAGFACGFAFSAARLGRPFRFPAVSDVERGIEAQSALHHRPLAALRDRPAGNPDGETLKLWEKHLRRLEKARGNLKIRRPRPDAARQDRYALRHAALLLFVMGLAIAGADAPARLEEGFHPSLPLSGPSSRAALDVWITPPAYTHRAPVFLASSQSGAAVARGPVAIPEGSVLKVRVSGLGRAPRLRYGAESRVLPKAAARSYAFEMPLKASGDIVLRHMFRDLGAWHVEVTPDEPPTVSIAVVGSTPRGALKIMYRAGDDYGVTHLTGTVAPPEKKISEPGDEVFAFDMPVPDGADKVNTFTVDLTQALRAGFPAQLTLTAEDGAGHVVETAPQDIILPERAFENPLAQRLIAVRKELSWADDILSRIAASAVVEKVWSRPDLYNGDFTTFLSLDSAARRILLDGGRRNLASVQGILWDVALRLEDGGLSANARDLSDALQRLSQALKNKDLPREELQKMLDDVNRKMREYLRALANELAQRMENGKDMPTLPPELAQKFMKKIDLDEVMRQLQAMSQGNPREAMQKMAEFLKNMVDNLDPSRLKQMQEAQKEAMEALQDLQDVINRQQALMDKTGRLDPKDAAKEEGREQDALRAKLGDVMRKLDEGMGEIPENFGVADQAMKRAQEAFGAGRPKESIPHQKAALDELQKGMDKAVSKMAQQMQQVILSFGAQQQGQERFGEGYDPLGRSSDDGGKEGGDLTLPDQRERQRVQDIIRELRGRSNDYSRPKVERDYIDRLLDQLD